MVPLLFLTRSLFVVLQPVSQVGNTAIIPPCVQEASICICVSLKAQLAASTVIRILLASKLITRTGGTKWCSEQAAGIRYVRSDIQSVFNSLVCSRVWGIPGGTVSGVAILTTWRINFTDVCSIQHRTVLISSQVGISKLSCTA